jgi:ATP adenylyltransferase
MIAPYRHVGSFGELSDEERAESMEQLALCERVLHDVFGPDGVNMGVNLGRSAGAGILGHLHIHLVPRWQGDTNFMPLFGNARVIPQGLRETAERLRDGFRKAVA